MIKNLSEIRECTSDIDWDEFQKNSILILEDDVAFVNDFINKFYNFYSNFNKDWDMIYFSGSLVELEDEECGEFYKRLKSCHTTHSYSVNKNIYDFLIKNYQI